MNKIKLHLDGKSGVDNIHKAWINLSKLQDQYDAILPAKTIVKALLNNITPRPVKNAIQTLQQTGSEEQQQTKNNLADFHDLLIDVARTFAKSEMYGLATTTANTTVLMTKAKERSKAAIAEGGCTHHGADAIHGSSECWHLHPELAPDWWNEQKAKNAKAKARRLAKKQKRANANIATDTANEEIIKSEDDQEETVLNALTTTVIPLKKLKKVKERWADDDIEYKMTWEEQLAYINHAKSLFKWITRSEEVKPKPDLIELLLKKLHNNRRNTNNKFETVKHQIKHDKNEDTEVELNKNQQNKVNDSRNVISDDHPGNGIVGQSLNKLNTQTSNNKNTTRYPLCMSITAEEKPILKIFDLHVNSNYNYELRLRSNPMRGYGLVFMHRYQTFETLRLAISVKLQKNVGNIILQVQHNNHIIQDTDTPDKDGPTTHSTIVMSFTNSNKPLTTPSYITIDDSDSSSEETYNEPNKRALVTVLMAQQCPKEKGAVLDTGAAVHVSKNRNAFSYINDPTIGGVTGLGGNTNICRGTGTIGKVTDVMYIPTAKHNLLSIGKYLDENEGEFIFTKNSAIYKKGRNTTHVGNRCRDGMYRATNHEYTLKTAAIAKEAVEYQQLREQIDEYHKKFGHLSKYKLKQIFKLYPQLKINPKYADLLTICSACNAGKFKKVPRPKLSLTKSKIFGERIVMDCTGKIPIKSRDGKQYAAVIVDEYSHWIWGYTLSTLKKTYKALEQVLHYHLHQRHDYVVKYFRSDGGTDMMSHQMNDILKQYGIKRETTCPSTSHQNGQAERHIGILFATIRTLLQDSNLPQNMWKIGVL